MHFEASADIRATGDRMVGLMSRSIPDLQPSFERFVQGLKAHAEAG